MKEMGEFTYKEKKEEKQYKDESYLEKAKCAVTTPFLKITNTEDFKPSQGEYIINPFNTRYIGADSYVREEDEVDSDEEREEKQIYKQNRRIEEIMSTPDRFFEYFDKFTLADLAKEKNILDLRDMFYYLNKPSPKNDACYHRFFSSPTSRFNFSTRLCLYFSSFCAPLPASVPCIPLLSLISQLHSGPSCSGLCPRAGNLVPLSSPLPSLLSLTKAMLCERVEHEERIRQQSRGGKRKRNKSRKSTALHDSQQVNKRLCRSREAGHVKEEANHVKEEASHEAGAG